MKNNSISFKCWYCNEGITIEKTNMIRKILESTDENVIFQKYLESSNGCNYEYKPIHIIIKCSECRRENYFGHKGANKGKFIARGIGKAHHTHCFKCSTIVNYASNLEHVSCGWLLCNKCHSCSPGCQKKLNYYFCN